MATIVNSFPNSVEFDTDEQSIAGQMDDDTLELQKLISTGMAWKMEGFIGRSAMRALESGQCFLPNESFRDYYGNRVPSREEIKEGSKGSIENCKNYYKNF